MTNTPMPRFDVVTVETNFIKGPDGRIEYSYLTVGTADPIIKEAIERAWRAGYLAGETRERARQAATPPYFSTRVERSYSTPKPCEGLPYYPDAHFCADTVTCDATSCDSSCGCD